MFLLPVYVALKAQLFIDFRLFGWFFVDIFPSFIQVSTIWTSL